mgnify:CR=1 FL=1
MKFSYTQFYDVSRALHAKMATYPGDPKFGLERVKQLLHDGVELSTVRMGLHNGTHTDAPSHFVQGATTIDKLSLVKFCGDAYVFDLTTVEGLIEEEHLKVFDSQLHEGLIVLLKTRNSSLDPNMFDEKFCALTESAAQYLASKQIKALGVDGPSVDRLHSGSHPVHHVCFDAGISVFENLYLHDVAAGEYVFFGFPLKIEGAEASPIRAVLVK